LICGRAARLKTLCEMWRATFEGGNLQVRFDERREETERCRVAQATAPLLPGSVDEVAAGSAAMFVGLHQ
jgi:hypothetical protein